MQETYYFGAGPAALPKSVLKEIQDEFLDYRDSGISILELAHRSEEFIAIRDKAEVLLRELLRIPSDYEVLFMHGGATSQFSMLPLNFLGQGETADYLCTGLWSHKAYVEAQRLAEVNGIDALHDGGLLSIGSAEAWDLNQNASYVHYCDNETIIGLAFNQVPVTQGVPLVCDMTSSILTRPIEIHKYGLIYASAQKNLGIAGLCLVIVNKELLNRTQKNIPRLYDYKQCAEDVSLTNTPPTFAIYVLSRLLDWVKGEGGVEEMHERNKQKSDLVYRTIDGSQLYDNLVIKEYRSNINIPFFFQDVDIQNRFLEQATLNNLLGLRGHKTVGGIRASFYNAMPQAGAETLVKFMQEFESKI